MRILIAEDDRKVAGFLKKDLKEEHYAVDVCYDAEDLSLRIEANNQKNEIGHLITTFNEMISRLERSVLQIKQFFLVFFARIFWSHPGKPLLKSISDTLK
jgi:methyl-accepting chemotaxis protein